MKEELFNAYANGQKELVEKNLTECIEATCPLSRTMAETIEKLRKWAEQSARLASTDKPEEVKKLESDVPVLVQESINPFIQAHKKA